jgi:hypothetical protein
MVGASNQPDYRIISIKSYSHKLIELEKILWAIRHKLKAWIVYLRN